MAGTTIDGELTATTERGGIRYAVATSADDTALRRLLRDNPMRGAISLSLEREPRYFAGASLAGARDITITAHEHNRLVCMGQCTTRACWINTESRRVSYLGELRLDGPAQGRFDILRRGYRFFHDLHREAPADFTFTSIAADNLRARRLLERGLPGMPRYEFLTEFVTLLIKVDRAAGETSRVRTAPEELMAFLNREAQRQQLAAVWTEEQLGALAHHGLTLDDFVILRDDAGRMVAAGSLWDQRRFRQTVIRGYSGPLRLARPAINLASRILGTPHLPKPGSVLAHAFVSPFAVAPDSIHRLPELLGMLRAQAAARGLEFLTFGFPVGDPRLAWLRAEFRCRAYVSRFYRVVWPDDPGPLTLEPRLIHPEIAFL